MKGFVVLTGSCLDIDADSHCDEHLIGPKAFSTRSLSFSCDYSYKWSLDWRLLDHTNAFVCTDLDEIRSCGYEQMRIEDQLPGIDPLKVIYVYYPPALAECKPQ
jgi:hypothetical protein